MKTGINKTIADAVGCHPSLVSLILSGKRPATTALHLRILAAQKTLKNKIESATEEIKNESK